MAYVITAVGAGGKTTYLKKRAQEFLRQGKKAALTTTTHIWPTLDLPDTFGTPEESGKLSAPDEAEYERICSEYDVVLVEGDGSHCMPAKIPGDHEPVVPHNTDEIVVIMGAHALGRRIDVVCQRYEGGSCQRMTEKMLEEIAERYYIAPLRRGYPHAKVSYVLSRIPGSKDRTAAVLMASGFGRRYGGNKLLDEYRGKPLYCHALDHVTKALGRENTIVVTQYDEIMQKAQAAGIDAVKNDQAAEGIAASIRIGTQRALDLGADAVLFFAADMPNLPAEEIRLFAGQFTGSGKPYGCMEFGKEHICTNPGAFRLENAAEKLLQLTGDRGAMRIMKQEPWNVYYYQIAPEWAADVDLRSSGG